MYWLASIPPSCVELTATSDVSAFKLRTEYGADVIGCRGLSEVNAEALDARTAICRYLAGPVNSAPKSR